MKDEIINSNEKFNFQNLLKIRKWWKPKPFEKYRAKVAAKKATIKKAIEDIPARIDEVKRGMPESEKLARIRIRIRAKNY